MMLRRARRPERALAMSIASRVTSSRPHLTRLIAVILFALLLEAASRAASSGEQEDAKSHAGRPLADSQAQPVPPPPPPLSQAQVEKQAFVMELLKVLHEQYGRHSAHDDNNLMQARQSGGGGASNGRQMMPQLLEALSAEGDARRLIDWVRNSFNLASIPEVATQFVVSKLGAVNCAALLAPDKEESLVPRFLLFNEHYTDVPFELPLAPSSLDCLANGKFDPGRQTVVLIHGYLGGYTLIDGLTNVKNRFLDQNRFASEKAIESFIKATAAHQATNSSYVFTEDLNARIRSQLYNVIIVDWFHGANPTPRSNYIKAAVNAQVVGKLIGRFLSALINQCGARANQVQLIGHSLGCHVAGFTGKALRANGHRLAKITHLDPVGLCFGRLFSRPRFRLSADDALETQAVHVSLNIFDNPLDGAHSNLLVNGGRDQPGCGNQNELSNSTTSSVSLLFDPAARFSPCSHLRAFALFEDDHSSEPAECQLVAHRCSSYERFLAGKCAACDQTNAQCRLMGLAPLSMQFRKLVMPLPRGGGGGGLASSASALHFHYNEAHFNEHEDDDDDYHTDWDDSRVSSPAAGNKTAAGRQRAGASSAATSAPRVTPLTVSFRIAPASRLAAGATQAPAALSRPTTMFGQPAYFVGGNGELASRRSERRLAGEKRERLSQALERLRTETRTALTSLRAGTGAAAAAAAMAHDEDSDLQAVDENRLQAEVGPLESEPADELAGSDATTAPARDATTAPTRDALTPPQQASLLTSNSQQQVPEAPRELDGGATDAAAGQRLAGDADAADQIPIGGQAIPAGSLNGPLFFLGTSSLSPYCVNYYQFRVLIAESRLQRMIAQNGLASNKLRAQYSGQPGGIMAAGASLLRGDLAAAANGRDMIHLTVKLTDSRGHFFKGFSLLESARALARVPNEFVGPALGALGALGGGGGGAQQAPVGQNEPMAEITLLLNSTRAQPIKVGETILSYYFHPIILADRLEINYMSNISPEIRAKFSSVLCPAAINDRHQLVKYVECHKVSKRRRKRRRRRR